MSSTTKPDDTKQVAGRSPASCYTSAVPTEYAGTTFRSKSEAMFARLLELSGRWYEYEPKWLAADDGVSPDFVIPRMLKDSLALLVVEYKPAIPTDEHLRTLRSRCLQWRDAGKDAVKQYRKSVSTYRVESLDAIKEAIAWEPVDYSALDEVENY